MNHSAEIAECRRRIALGESLNTLLNFDNNFRTVIKDGFLRDEVLRRSLNINADKSGTVGFLKAVSVFSDYLNKVKADAEQASIDLQNYLNMPK